MRTIFRLAKPAFFRYNENFILERDPFVFKAPPRQVLVHHADEANKVESADHGCLIPSRYSDIPDIFIFVRLPDTEHDQQNSN